MYSGRDLVKSYPEAKPFLNKFDTTIIGTVLPQFKEEFGEGKRLDIVFSPSHDLFLDGVKNAKPTGLYMDKNGNFKFQLNVPLQLNVETKYG